MYLEPSSPSRNALRKIEICWARFDSSTKVSGHTLRSSSSFSSRRPRFSTRKTKASNAFGDSRTGVWPRRSRRSAGFKRNGPNSKTAFVSRDISPFRKALEKLYPGLKTINRLWANIPSDGEEGGRAQSRRSILYRWEAGSKRGSRSRCGFSTRPFRWRNLMKSNHALRYWKRISRMRPAKARTALAVATVLAAAIITIQPMQAQTTFTTLASFDGTNGSYSLAPLIQATNGNLYGTTNQATDGSGYGNIFEITTGGTLTSLYSFCKGGPPCSDGYGPVPGLVQTTNGDLYGT